MTDWCNPIVPLAAYLFKVSLVHSLFKHVSRGQFNYYIAELAFYCSLMFSQFIDIKRKVSKQPLVSPSLFSCDVFVFLSSISGFRFISSGKTGSTKIGCSFASGLLTSACLASI